MNRKFGPIFIGLVLMLVAVACGGGDATDTPVPATDTPIPPTATPAPPTATPVLPSPTPEPALELESEAFHNLRKGYTMQYPEGWQRYDAWGDDLFIADDASAQEVMDEDKLPSVPLVVVAVGLLDDIGSSGMDEAKDVQEMVDDLLIGISESGEDFEKGEEQEIAIAGESGLSVDFAMICEGTPAAGRLVAVHMGDRGIIITSMGTVETWGGFLPTLDAMLASMILVEPIIALELTEEHVSDKGGYAILYPEGWQTLDFEGAAFIFESDDIMQDEFPTVPIVLIDGGPLETVSEGEVAGAIDAQEMILAIAEARSSEGDEFEMSEMREVTVGGEPAVAVDLSWTQDGIAVAGRAVAIHMGDWGIVIQSASVVDGWEPFIPVLDEILASILIFEPTGMTGEAPEPIRQWAVAAEASSQYSDPNWSADQATGAPDTPECGDYETAWASSGSSTEEWIDLFYDLPVYPTEINIIQSYNPDQIIQVELIDLDGQFITVYTQEPEQVDAPCPYTLSISVDEDDLLVWGVRVTIDQSVLGLGWNEIDAVELVGVPDEGAAVQPLPPTEEPAGPPEGFIGRIGGESGWEEDQFNAISGMDIGPNGNLYVADSLGHIRVVSPDGEVLPSIDEGDLWTVSDVQVAADGTVYAADWGSNAIFVFSAAGELLHQWGQEGAGDGEFGDFSPQYLAVCPNGLVYVVDPNEDANGDDYERIQVFDGNGKYLAQWNISAIDDLFGIAGMDCAADGNLYLVGFMGGYVMVLDPEGTQLAALGEDALAYTAPHSLAVGPDGNIYLGTWNEGVLLLDSQGNLLAQWGVSTDEDGPRFEGELHFADGIAVDAAGNVYVGDWSGGYSYITKFVFP